MEDKYVAILMEEMNSKFELVLEGHQVLRSDMRRMEETLSKKIDENTTRIKINTEAIAALDKKLSKRIDEVDEKLSKRIDEVDEKLSKRIDEVDEKLSKRIDEVDEKLSKHIDAVGADLKAHRADTEAHHGIYQVRESSTYKE